MSNTNTEAKMTSPKCEKCGQPMKFHGFQVVSDRDAEVWMCDGNEQLHARVKVVR